MTTYSTDEDLVPVFVQDAETLPDSLVPHHEAAYAQIRRDLVGMGRTAAELDSLTSDTLAALKVPSCHYVLHLLFQSQTHGRTGDLFELAKHHLGEYQRTLRSTVIESTADPSNEPPRATGGYVVLA